MVIIPHRNVPVVCGASYHLLGYRISQDSKIRFRLQVESYISDWLFSESRLLASYVSRHKAMAYDSVMSTPRYPSAVPSLWRDMSSFLSSSMSASISEADWLYINMSSTYTTTMRDLLRNRHGSRADAVRPHFTRRSVKY